MPTAGKLGDAALSRSGAEARSTRAHAGPYVRFAAMGALSFVSMYVLMYAMVDQWSHVFPNVNRAYMAGLMTAPMLIFELALMSSMYESKRANATIHLASAGALVVLWLVIRAQAGVGDDQFLKSMIPHHSSAILMCQQAALEDPATRRLCGEIIESQEREIAIMQAMLRERGER